MAISEPTQFLPPVSAPRHRIASVWPGMIARVQRWRDVRQTQRIIGQLSDKQLNDVGLTRDRISGFVDQGGF